MQYGSINVNGIFDDWTSTSRIDNPANSVNGYNIFGSLQNDATLGKHYVLGFQSTLGTDLVIGANTTLWLNTDGNTATGVSPFGSVGAEYYVNFVSEGSVLKAYLYAANNTLVSATPLDYAVSADGKGFEIAIAQSLLTPAGGAAPGSISLVADVNDLTFLPGDYASAPQYRVTDPSTLVEHAASHRVAIVWSETSAALYFSKTAYADVIMAAQHQATMAGVTYDIINESDLTSLSTVLKYDAVIFPEMHAVNSANLAAIKDVLYQAEYNYHVGMIVAGDFMTNDQTGAPLAGNSYANMQALIGINRVGGSNGATYTVTPGDLTNHALDGYLSSDHLGGATGTGLYTNTGYSSYAAIGTPGTTLANINIVGGGSVAGVIQTTTGGLNTHFATQQLMTDSNLLSHVIQSTVLGTLPTLALETTRMDGVMAVRVDMDQSQFPSDVAPLDANGAALPGIYDKMMPIIAQWKSQFNFVGSYYLNIGDNPASATVDYADSSSTNWAKSLPYYRALLALGGEIGNHSYTHLINPPAGIAVENTNLLNTGTGKFTFDYEFNQSKAILEQQLGIKILGAAVPGAAETILTAEQIMQYYQSVAGTIGYMTGGWTGIGSGAPSAFGYLSPNDQGAVYIAPNITFDFTEIGFQHNSPEVALQHWKDQMAQIGQNSNNPTFVLPVHDYGIAAWNTDGTTAASPYTTQMYTDILAYAANLNYEFVTLAELAARTAAQQKAHVSYTTVGGTITATVTPDAAAPDLGGMSLKVVNGAAGQVIKNAGNWYAYDTNHLFLPRAGGTFAVTLGAAQDDVTHLSKLAMRADLLAVSGDGANLNFSFTGDGKMVVDLASPANGFVSIQGAPAASLAGDLLTLTFADTRLLPLYAPLQHSVVIHDGATAFLTAGSDIVFGNAGDNAFFGSGGNDYLNALGGTDTMNLGAQFQSFIFSLNADGSVNAQDRRGGSPLGRDVLLNFELFHFSDGLLLTLAQLTATQGSTTITGTAGNDVLDGTASNQLILGLAGNDIINARFSNETLDGGGGADQLFDNGFDFISLIGGGGGDIFYVNNAGTSVTEVAGGTSDTIRTTLNTYVLPANIEFLEFVGSGDFAATANAANQRLSGAAGNDTLGNGGFATVRLTGGGGNDTYTVTGATATIVEAANGGTDTVLTTLNSYTTLAGNVENLTFTGTGNFTGNGNGLANILTGGAGDDTLSANGGIDRLIGGIGNDRMTGGGLNDTFVFNPGFGRDIITDFRANANNPNNHDILELSASMFAVGTTASSLLNDLTHVAQVGANVVITVDAADTITLNNVNLNTLKLYAATDILLI